MLKVYRRHNPALCPHKERTWRRCSCPLWADGSLGGKRYHKTLKTRNWDVAQQKVQRIEAEGKDEPKQKTIKEATEAFIRDTKARGLREPSIYKYELLFKQLEAFAADTGIRNLIECDVDALRRFRESWKNENYSARRKLGNLRTFFNFVQEAGWLETNPAKVIKPPKVEDPPTLPYTQEEFERVIKACDKYPRKHHAIKLKALVLLLRYSGLRITDAVTLTKQRITNGVLTLRTAKTGTPVRLPLHPDALAALDRIQTYHYYFWSGDGKTKSCVGDYQRAFKRLYELAEVENGHAHRWRDTFAVELLLKRVPIADVSVLLGHQSVKITEKHYSPWVLSRQEQLEDTVRKTF